MITRKLENFPATKGPEILRLGMNNNMNSRIAEPNLSRPPPCVVPTCLSFFGLSPIPSVRIGQNYGSLSGFSMIGAG